MRRDPVIGAMEIGEERAVPGLTDLGNVCLHIARYNFALLYCDKKKVVDAACGSGYGSSILSLVAAHVTGIDISESAISYANTRFSLANGEYKLGDLSDMKEEADVIVSFETTEHLPDLQKWEGAVYRSLVPGGTFIFSVPLNEVPGDNPYHQHVFTLESARALFPSLLRGEEVIQQGLNFYPLAPGQNATLRYLAYIGVMKRPG